MDSIKTGIKESNRFTFDVEHPEGMENFPTSSSSNVCDKNGFNLLLKIKIRKFEVTGHLKDKMENLWKNICQREIQDPYLLIANRIDLRRETSFLSISSCSTSKPINSSLVSSFDLKDKVDVECSTTEDIDAPSTWLCNHNEIFAKSSKKSVVQEEESEDRNVSMRWLRRNPSSRNYCLDLVTADYRLREWKKGKESSEPCNSSKSCCFDCQKGYSDHHCPNSITKHRHFSSPDTTEAWWVPPPEEKIPPTEGIHEISPEEEILPVTIIEELPPPLTVDTPSTEENPTLTESIHEIDNGFDEVIKDGDKVVGSNEAAGENDKAIKDNDEAAGDDDETAGETSSTSSSRNKCENFMNSQPMMNQVQGYGISKFGYASGYNVPCAKLEGKILFSALLMNHSSQIVSVSRLDCALVQDRDNSLEMESDNKFQAIKSDKELDMLKRLKNFIGNRMKQRDKDGSSDMLHADITFAGPQVKFHETSIPCPDKCGEEMQQEIKELLDWQWIEEYGSHSSSQALMVCNEETMLQRITDLEPFPVLALSSPVVDPKPLLVLELCPYLPFPIQDPFLIQDPIMEWCNDMLQQWSNTMFSNASSWHILNEPDSNMLTGDMQHEQSVIIYYAVNQHEQDESEVDNITVVQVRLQLKQQQHDIFGNIVSRQAQEEFGADNWIAACLHQQQLTN
eukprot:Gb_14121 [translate_table: standard]